MKPHSGMKRGGAVGKTDVADERDAHRDHEHVAHEVEVAVVAQVQVQQRPEGNGGLRVDVDASWQTSHHHVAARRPRLDEGSTKRCSVRSSEIRSRAWAKACVGVALDHAAHQPVGEIGDANREICRSASSQPCGRTRACRRRARATIESKPRRCSVAAGSSAEDPGRGEVDLDVGVPGPVGVQQGPVFRSLRDASGDSRRAQ